MIAILGAGSGGLALASYLEDRNVNFTIWNRSDEKIEKFRKNNNIVKIKNSDKDLERDMNLNNLTGDLESTIKNNKYFFIITPGTAHKEISRAVKDYICEKKVFILMPGRTYGCAEFKENLGNKKGLVDVYETQTILHASRLNENELSIFGEKKEVYFSSPESPSEEDKEFIERLIPKMKYTDDYYGVTLNNIGAMLHPVPSILNIARIENGGSYSHYTHGISPLVSHFIEEIDAERGIVCKAVGAKFVSVQDWLKLEYGAEGKNLHEALQNNKAYLNVMGPKDIEHRYIFDDILTGLVPIYKTAIKNEICVKKIETFLKFASSLLDYDFIKEGRGCI